MDILPQLLEFKDFIFAFFVGVSAWYSYKLGCKRGLEYGIDRSIDYLAEAGLIDIEYLEDGEIKLSKAK